MSAKLLAPMLLAVLASGAGAATFTDRSAFYAALDSYAVIDTSAHIGQYVDAIDDSYPGATFFGPRSFVRGDDLLLNGAGFWGSATPHVGLNFDTPIQGAGVTTNPYDGGDVILYSGLNGTGTELGRANFGDNLVTFGALTITGAARSVVFTCDFNSDLKCGLRDIAFGRIDTQTAPQVPVPAAGGLLAAAAGLIGLLRRRRPA